MTTTASVSITGNAYTDGVLSGVRWGTNTLTYSFPTSGSFYGANYGSGEPSNGFQAFTAAQQTAVKSVLQLFSSVANLTFTQVTESATAHGELRYAESNSPGTAYAYYPSTAAIGGDLWFNQSSGQYNTPARGNYAWTTLIHETGHAVGLKHPHESSGSFGTMPTDKDSVEYTVMSYRSYVGASTSSGYVNGPSSFPTTLMMYDIAALQKMYGANYNTNSGNTVYKWDPSTGEMSVNGVAQGKPVGNKVFMTVWDGGGADTYDFSNYTTAVKVDLSPGGWSTTSSTQLADLGGGRKAVGTIANSLLYNNNAASLIENVVGTAAADSIFGNAAANTFTGGQGNDTLDGQGGTDTALFSSASSNYTWMKMADGSYTVTDKRVGGDGVDIVRNIEQLKFTDKTVTIDSTYTATTAGTGGTGTGTQTTVNQAPTANADAYTMRANSTVTASVSVGVLKNDTDPNGDKLTAVLVSGPSKGTLKLASDGSFTYKAAANFYGSVTFTYKASDGKAQSAATTVTIKVGTSAANGNASAAAFHDVPPYIGGDTTVSLFGFSFTKAPGGHGPIHGSDTGYGLSIVTWSDPHGPGSTFDAVFQGNTHSDYSGVPDFLSSAWSEFTLA